MRISLPYNRSVSWYRTHYTHPGTVGKQVCISTERLVLPVKVVVQQVGKEGKGGRSMCLCFMLVQIYFCHIAHFGLPLVQRNISGLNGKRQGFDPSEADRIPHFRSRNPMTGMYEGGNQKRAKRKKRQERISHSCLPAGAAGTG